VNFDHDAAFALVGEHRDVACAGCHVREADIDYTVYSPLSHECESCHVKGTVQGNGGSAR
jgi:hypothetical protein